MTENQFHIRVLRSRPVRDFGLMTIGLILTAWALDAFLIPNRIAAGGVSGLATVLYHTMRDSLGIVVPIGVQLLIANAVLLAVAVRSRGIRYALKTIYGIVGMSVFIDVLAPVTPTFAAHDLLLAAIYGGLISGVGIGLVFKAGGTTGGTDIVAQLLSRRVPFGLGQIMFVADALVTLVAALKFGPTLALYGVVAIIVASYSIDLVLEGIPVEKAAWIISDRAAEIAEAVTHDLGRGATFMSAKGAWTGEERGMLFVVLSRNEIDGLKQVVGALDPQAMVVISDVHETIGEGFKEMSAG